MSYKFPYSPKFFKEKLDFQQQIIEQESEIRKALNYGTLREIANTVKVLELLISAKMTPKNDKLEFEIDTLNELLNQHYQAKELEYQDRMKDSICPDVVKKPNKSLGPRWYYENKFNLLINFFDRLGLGLQHERDSHF